MLHLLSIARTSDFVKLPIVLLAVFSFGGFYYVLGLRSIFLKEPLRAIDDNINERLLELGPPQTQAPLVRKKLTTGRQLLDVF